MYQIKHYRNATSSNICIHNNLRKIILHNNMKSCSLTTNATRKKVILLNHPFTFIFMGKHFIIRLLRRSYYRSNIYVLSIRTQEAQQLEKTILSDSDKGIESGLLQTPIIYLQIIYLAKKKSMSQLANSK